MKTKNDTKWNGNLHLEFTESPEMKSPEKMIILCNNIFSETLYLCKTDVANF